MFDASGKLSEDASRKIGELTVPALAMLVFEVVVLVLLLMLSLIWGPKYLQTLFHGFLIRVIVQWPPKPYSNY